MPKRREWVEVKSAVSRIQLQLENASFLSPGECVELARAILQLSARDARIPLRHDLGLNEAVMLITSSRVEIRNAYLLLICMFHWFKRNVATSAPLIQNSYLKASTEGERILILNALCLMRLPCGLLLECYQPQIFSLKLPTAQLNRWLVYCIKSTRIMHQPGLPHNLRKADVYHLGLDTSTCSVLSQCLREHIVEGDDAQFLFLIPPLVRRMAHCIRTNENCHFGIPDPWFLTFSLKLLRAFSPLRFRCADQSSDDDEDDQRFASELKAPRLHCDSPVNSENDDFLREWNRASVDLSLQFRKATTMPASNDPKPEPILRRDTAPSVNYLIPPPRKHRFRTALKRMMGAKSETVEPGPTRPVLSADLNPATLYTVMERFLVDLFDWAAKIDQLIRTKRHSQNMLAMILSEAVQWIFFVHGYTNPKNDVLIDLALAEFRRQMQHSNAQMRRNSLDMFAVAMTNVNLRKRRLVRQILDRLETLPNENFMKRGYFKLLVDWYSNFGGEPDGADMSDWVLNAMVLSLSVKPAVDSTNDLETILTDPRLTGWTHTRQYESRESYTVQTGNEIVSLICKLMSLNVDAIDDMSLVDLVLQLVNTSCNWKPCYWLVCQKPYAVQQLILHGRNHFLTGTLPGKSAIGSALGLIKLTIKLIGDSAAVAFNSELARFMQVLRGSSNSGPVAIPWWVDNEMIVLSLDAAGKLLPHLDDENERNLIMNTINSFVKHHDLDVQLCAAEKWLTIVKSKFSTKR